MEPHILSYITKKYLLDLLLKPTVRMEDCKSLVHTFKLSHLNVDNDSEGLNYYIPILWEE